MELHSFHRELAVTKPYDDGAPIAIPGAGADLEIGWKTFLGYDQGVISGCCHRRREISENGLSIVRDFAGFAMHEVRSANDFPSERSSNRLVSETNTEDR